MPDFSTQFGLNMVIPPAAFQGSTLTAGSAYWINPLQAGTPYGQANNNTASLVLAGTSISAAGVSVPPWTLDLSQHSNPSWSLYYGAQTGGVGMKIGMAELWPMQPPEASGVISSYVRDATGHYLAAGGLTQLVQRTIPGGVDAIWDFTTAANTAVTTPAVDMEDFEEVFVDIQFSGAQTGCTLIPYEVDATGNALQVGPSQAITASATYAAISWGPGSSFGSGGLTGIQAMLPWRTQFAIGAAGSGVTTRVRITGKRRLPIRRIWKVAPYIQALTWPTTGTSLYVDIRSAPF
jgi:hypothetical protein